MDGWAERLRAVAVEVERQFDRAKARMGRVAGPRDGLTIAAYRGFGSPRALHVKARVLEDQGIAATLETDGRLRNLLNMYRRFESDEVPQARVRARHGAVEAEFVADEEGYVDIALPPRSLPANTVWHDVELSLVSHPDVRATASVLVPPPSAGFGVISDLDDTVLQTNVGDLIHMARTVFLGNARTRLPFPGVSAFYRALQSDGAGGSFNPLFYVSGSPWNLYDLLMEFLIVARVPVGPLFLRDWGLSERGLGIKGHREHKLRDIVRIMDEYPDLPFILVGDSGEQDPEIYAEVVTRYPGRVHAIYIRNVSRDLARPEAIQALAAKVVEAGSALVLANDTVGAARHAVEKGYIAASSLPEIETVRVIETKTAAPSPAPALTVAVTPAATEVTQGAAVAKAVENAAPDQDTPPTVVVDEKPA